MTSLQHRSGNTRANAQQQRTLRRSLAVIELSTGVTGLAGGVLLAIRPDGSLLRADRSVLAGTPFSDWRVPGVLLATLVGGGFVLTGWWTWRNHRYGRELSLFAGTGLVAFETAELAWLGFQPLEGVFAAVGVITVALAWRMRDTPGSGPRRAFHGTLDRHGGRGRRLDGDVVVDRRVAGGGHSGGEGGGPEALDR